MASLASINSCDREVSAILADRRKGLPDFVAEIAFDFRVLARHNPPLKLVGSSIGEGASGIVFKAVPVNPDPAERQFTVKFYNPRHQKIIFNSKRDDAVSQCTDSPALSRMESIVYIQNGQVTKNPVEKKHALKIAATSRFYPGGDLGSEIERNQQSNDFPDPMTFIHQTWPLVNGIKHMHALGIVHRDIKPSNILRDEDGTWVLTDWDLAKEISQQRPNSPLIGTNAFIAPEAFEAETDGTIEEDPRPRDIWALGATFFYFLTHVPYIAKNIPLNELELTQEEKEQFIQRQEARFALLLEHPIGKVLQGMLNPNPKTRFTASRLVTEMDSFFQI